LTVYWKTFHRVTSFLVRPFLSHPCSPINSFSVEANVFIHWDEQLFQS
jgi:hypothetical protein